MSFVKRGDCEFIEVVKTSDLTEKQKETTEEIVEKDEPTTTPKEVN